MVRLLDGNDTEGPAFIATLPHVPAIGSVLEVDRTAILDFPEGRYEVVRHVYQLSPTGVPGDVNFTCDDGFEVLIKRVS